MNPNEYLAFVKTKVMSITYEMRFYKIGAVNFIFPRETLPNMTSSQFNVEAGDTFTITNSTSNNGTYTVKAGGANNILDGGSFIYVNETFTNDITFQIPTITGTNCFDGTRTYTSEWFELGVADGIGISLESIPDKFVGDTLTINWDTIT